MKAKEKAPKLEAADISGFYDQHIVATNIRLPRNRNHLEYFLKKHPEDRPLEKALESVFDGLTNVHELGSLVQIEELVGKELLEIKTLRLQKTLFGPETDEEWKTWERAVVTQLKEHFDVEAVHANVSQSFFSLSAEKGLILFDLLSRRYDVVAANPPYMGIGNTGDRVGSYLKSHYSLSKYDLYAAFIRRCIDLCAKNGYVSMITQQSWMYIRSFSRFRLNSAKHTQQEDRFSGLLAATTIESLVHIGPRGFSDISGEVVNSVMFILRNSVPPENHKMHAITIIDVEGADEKSRELLEVISSNSTAIGSRKFCISQRVLSTVPEASIIYDAPEDIFKLFLLPKRLQDVAVIESGLKSGDNDRWVRNIWEVSDLSRWVRLLKGGKYSRWTQEVDSVVDWRKGVQQHYKDDKIARVSGIANYFKEGISYNIINTNGLSGKYLAPGCIFNNATPTIFAEDKWYQAFICCAFNSVLFRYLAFSLNPTINFNVGDAKKLPMPTKQKDSHVFELIMEACVAMKSKKDQNIERGITSIREYLHNVCSLTLKQAVVKCLIEGLNNILVYRVFGINRLISLPINIAFQSPTVFKAVAGYNNFADLPVHSPELGGQVTDYLASELNTQVLQEHELNGTKQRLRALYEAGPGATAQYPEPDTLNDDDETRVVGARTPIPSETFLEELSVKLKIHPISIYWLLKEGIEGEGWRCAVEEQRIIADQFSIIALSLFGYQSYEEIQEGKLAPDWANPSGIIPLTEGFGEKTLLDRLRERIAVEFGVENAVLIEKEFAEVMEKSLSEWLSTEFFEHHFRQFKKRPILWQIESSPRAQDRPAFSCIVHYHKLDYDLLHKIRRQYVEPLRIRYETELRTIESVQMPSADQTGRHLILESLVEELEEFGTRLEEVISSGFDSLALRKIVSQEPLDDWTSIDGKCSSPSTRDLFYIQEKGYISDLNDGVRVNVAPLQKAGLLAAEVLPMEDVDIAISERAEWRRDERRWCREGKLPKPGWWKTRGGNI
jgi:hypothetical protein